MLSSSESWYGLKKVEIKALEQVDKIQIRKIRDAPQSSCIESLYLELGIVPIHILVKARRINYYHYLVKQQEVKCCLIFLKHSRSTQLKEIGPFRWHRISRILIYLEILTL